MSVVTAKQVARAEAHADPLPRNQYPALLARLEALEKAVVRLCDLIEKSAS